MRFIVRTGVVLFTVLSLILPAFAAQGVKRPSEELKHDIGDLKNNPADRVLREKIIKTVTNMKQPPAVPEEAERNMARGTAFAQKASDNTGYRKAIMEFEAALNAAPWLALAYYNLGVVQEKSGLFNEAIQSLKFYLLAAPNAKNAREVKNKIYALEAEAEAVQAGMNAPESAPDAPGGGKQLSVAGKQTLEIEPEKELKIIKMPLDQKTKMHNFAGKWYFKENIRGEDVTIHAFEIARNGNGDLTLIPPKRAADSVATVNVFEIADRTLKLQMKWRMRSVVGYWKTETYILQISDNGAKLTGSHNQKSVGGRNIDMDRILFRQ